MTPLHYAARYGKIDSATKSEKTWKAIAFLMKHSTEKNGKDKYGFTVLCGEKLNNKSWRQIEFKIVEKK